MTDRKTRLEKTIQALENGRADLVVRLEAATLTGDQVQDIVSFAAELVPGLEEAEEDLTARRALVRKLKVQAVLSTEADGCQVVDVSCVIGSGRFVLRQLAQRQIDSKQNAGLVVTARLVLDSAPRRRKVQAAA